MHGMAAFASVGALKPEKCSWCHQGQWYYTSPDTQPGALTIPVPHGEPISITCHGSLEAIEVVGITQALADGNMSAQVQVLQAKAEKWGVQIREGWVPRNLACKALDTMIWPSLCYPLPTCNLAEPQRELIMKLLYHQMLPSLGTCCNFPMVY